MKRVRKIGMVACCALWGGVHGLEAVNSEVGGCAFNPAPEVKAAALRRADLMRKVLLSPDLLDKVLKAVIAPLHRPDLMRVVVGERKRFCLTVDDYTAHLLPLRKVCRQWRAVVDEMSVAVVVVKRLMTTPSTGISLACYPDGIFPHGPRSPWSDNHYVHWHAAFVPSMYNNAPATVARAKEQLAPFPGLRERIDSVQAVSARLAWHNAESLAGAPAFYGLPLDTRVLHTIVVHFATFAQSAAHRNGQETYLRDHPRTPLFVRLTSGMTPNDFLTHPATRPFLQDRDVRFGVVCTSGLELSRWVSELGFRQTDELKFHPRDGRLPQDHLKLLQPYRGALTLAHVGHDVTSIRGFKCRTLGCSMPTTGAPRERVSGVIFDACPNLQSLTLGNFISPNIGALTTLVELRLNYGPTVCVKGLPHLRFLAIHRCVESASLADLPSLRVVELTHCALRSVKNCPQLAWLQGGSVRPVAGGKLSHAGCHQEFLEAFFAAGQADEGPWDLRPAS